MKRTALFIFGLIIITFAMAQAPQGISHQAVIRDAGNELVVNSTIGIQVSILQGSANGEAVYVETHTSVSNANGLVSYIIGHGDVGSGDFSAIDWSVGPYFLKTETDPLGGTAYSITGVTRFLSVPYSFYSEASERLKDGTHTGEIIYWNGEQWVTIDPLMNGQTLTICNNIPRWGPCGVVPCPDMPTVTDIDGNVYNTALIGNQCWTRENLRVTRYNNNDPITTGLNNDDWGSTTDGAYSIYDHTHSSADGINSPEEMVDAYGKLYNWYAVDDTRGLCPEGWSVPSNDDWTILIDYVVAQGFANDWENPNGAGNALKSCRQVVSPMSGVCDTNEHPRWDSNNTHHGIDEFGFSAHAGSSRFSTGFYSSVGLIGYWWSSGFYAQFSAKSVTINHYSGHVGHSVIHISSGFSVRCVRNVDN